MEYGDGERERAAVLQGLSAKGQVRGGEGLGFGRGAEGNGDMQENQVTLTQEGAGFMSSSMWGG